MNPYEGLNLPQLMELMHGLQTPPPVSLWPSTPGWWVVAAWLVLMISLLAVHSWRRWHRNRYRREAIATLSKLQEQVQAQEATAAGKNVELAAELAAVLKRTALAAYPRTQVAHLHGSQWAAFLSSTCKGDAQVEQASENLAQAAYNPGISLDELFAPALRWVRGHRA